MTARLFSRADLAELIDLYAEELDECAAEVEEQARLEREAELSHDLGVQALTLRMVAVAMRRGMIGELHASTLQEIRSLPEVGS